MLSWTRSVMLGFAMVGGVGCATPGTRPHDMSAAEHEKKAQIQEAEAAEHAARFDPAQTTKRRVCNGRAPCWTGEVNPTDGHRVDAAKLQATATKHRKAAETLRAAETDACAGLDPADRELSPFFHRDDIERVEPLYRGASFRSRALSGATIVFADVPGLSREWMQQSLDCHVARNAALGFDAPEMAYCPLASKGVRAVASETGGRIRVEVTAGDAVTAEEILRRAQLLAPR